MNKTLEWLLASIPAFLAVASYAGFVSGHALGIALGIVAATLCVIAMFALKAAERRPGRTREIRIPAEAAFLIDASRIAAARSHANRRETPDGESHEGSR